MITGSNIDDVRAEIMRLESAQVHDIDAWMCVCDALATQCRWSGLADAQRRMQDARGRQVLHVRTDLGMGGNLIELTLVPVVRGVAVETQSHE